MNYYLAPYVDVGFESKGLSMGFGSLQKHLKNPQEQQVTLRVAHLWKEVKDKGTLEKEYVEKYGNKLGLLKAINFLKDNNYLIQQVDDVPDRYSRNYLYYGLNGEQANIVQKKLQSSHIVILGAGGIGNYVASSLIGMGIGKLTIVDEDIVELSNLSRQIMFDEGDIGKSKTSVLKKKLNNRNSSIEIEVLNTHIKNEKDLSRLPLCDFIIMSADTPADLILWVNRYCIKNKTPFMNVGYVMDIAVWGPLVVSGETGCVECNSLFSDSGDNLEEAELVRLINKGFRPPSIGPINMLASSMALLDVIKFLGGFGDISSLNKRMGIWTHSLKVDYQDCSKNEDCRICGGVN